MSWRLASIYLLSLMICGCDDWSLLTRCIDNACGTDAAADANARDASSTFDAFVDPCPGNLLDAPAFESVSASWQNENAASSFAPGQGRNGSAAYKVCWGQPTSYFALIQVLDAGLVAKGHYTASAWARSASGGSQQVTIGFVENDAHYHQAIDVALPSTWFQLTDSYTMLDATPSTLKIRVMSEKPPQDGDCFFIDDACLQQK